MRCRAFEVVGEKMSRELGRGKRVKARFRRPTYMDGCIKIVNTPKPRKRNSLVGGAKMKWKD